MSRIILWILLLLLTFPVWAQEREEVPEDTLEVAWHEKVDWTNLGINAQISRQSAPTPGGMQVGAWLSTGVFIKRWQVGAFVATYQDSYEQMLIFPNQFQMNYLYGGFYAGYTLLQNRWFQSNLAAAIGRGDVLWERSLTFENYYRDTFTMSHFMLEFEMTPIRFVRPILQVSYRNMSPINLPELNRDQFTGLSMLVGVRFGLYTKRPIK